VTASGTEMTRRRKSELTPEEERENALRPDRRLGYDRDQLGGYFMDREAYALAESQFRRASWLNPYEPKFKVHQAWARSRMGDREGALQLLDDVLRDHPNHAEAAELRRRLVGHPAGS